MKINDIVFSLMIYTLIIISILLFSKKKKHLSIWLLGFYSLVQIICVGNYFIDMNRDFIYFNLPQIFFIPPPFLFVIIPLFFLFIKTSINRDFKFGIADFGHFALFTIAFFFFAAAFWFHSKQHIHDIFRNDQKFLFFMSLTLTILFNLQYIVYSLWLLIELKSVNKNKSQLMNTVFSYSVLKFTIITYVLGCVLSLTTNGIQFTSFQYKSEINFLNSYYFYAFFIFLFFISIKSYINREVFKYNNTETDLDSLKSLYDKILENLNSSQPFKEPALSLKVFAGSINENPRLVSQAINHFSGSTFNDLMNFYRTELAKQMLLNMPHLSIKEIMYETGFSSKATFNKVFRSYTNSSPSGFRENK